jgi:hypothetical protein
VGSLVELGGVKETTDRDLDTLAEGLGVSETEDTSVVDLGLDESGVVEVGLGTDLEGDATGGGLGVVDSLGTGLDVLVDLISGNGARGASAV